MKAIMKKMFKIVCIALFLVNVFGCMDSFAQIRCNSKYLLIGPDSVRDVRHKFWISDYNGILLKNNTCQLKVARMAKLGRICISSSAGVVDFVDKDDIGNCVYNQIKCYECFARDTIWNTKFSTVDKQSMANNYQAKALDIVSKLRPVNFDWNNPRMRHANADKVSDKEDESGVEMGLIAQEVELLFPELVSTDAAGNKLVNYIGLLPLLKLSLMELTEQINNRDKEIEELQKQLEILSYGTE